MKRRPWLFWALQAGVTLAVGLFLWRAIARNVDAFRNIEFAFTVRPAWIAASAVTVLGTYFLLIAAWRSVLVGWDQGLPVPAAVRIWTLSNLGRYLPGKVWSLAGLAVLAQRAGVAAWAAGGSAIAMQVVAVGTGVAAVAATAPGAVSPTSLAIAGGLVVAVVATLVRPGPVGLLARLLDRTDLRPLRPGALAAAFAATSLAWVAYGLAFWLLARGLLGPVELPLITAVGVFAAGYITGLVAIFAPGGVGVREVMLIGLLTPAVGSGAAVALSIASRLLLTVTEVVAALIGLLIPGTEPQSHDAT